MDNYVIDAVRDHRGDADAAEYLVKWEGYESDSAGLTWEPRSGVEHTTAFEEYEAALTNRPRMCPITLSPMDDPVLVRACGHEFDRSAIEGWIRQGGTANSPMLRRGRAGSAPCPICRMSMRLEDIQGGEADETDAAAAPGPLQHTRAVSPKLQRYPATPSKSRTDASRRSIAVKATTTADVQMRHKQSTKTDEKMATFSGMYMTATGLRPCR